MYLSIFIAAFLPLRYLNGDILMNLIDPQANLKMGVIITNFGENQRVRFLCPNLGSPGQVKVPETTSSFSQVGKALVKP